MKQYKVKTPFKRITIDTAGPFPKSRRGNHYTLVARDYFSELTKVYALPNEETSTVTATEALIENIFS